MSIIVTKKGEAPVRLERRLIDKEDYLQKTVYENPESIPLHEAKADIRLLVLAREFPTGSGPIDALGIDADGDIYIIETKLYKNADKRRVVAQALDYGASLWSVYAEPNDFIDEIDRRTRKLESGTPLTQRLTEFYDLADEGEADEILSSIRRNVTEGRFRFVVLMDRLDERLRDLIRYVNQNSRFDIYGVELDFYRHGEFEIIIPNLFGAEVRKEVDAAPARAKRRWDAESFFATAASELPRDVARALRALYDWAVARADTVTWGSGTQTGSFNVKISGVHPTRSVLSAYTSGALQLNFKALTGDEMPAETREAILALSDRLRTNASLALPSDVTDSYYNVQPQEWSPRVEAIIAEFDKLCSLNG